MPSLNRTLLSNAKRLDGDLTVSSVASSLPPIRILQIGDGNFLRAFADWMIDVANGAGLMNANVTMAASRSHGIVDKLNAQDGLFTVLIRGMQDGNLVRSRRIVTCVGESIKPQTGWQSMLACAADPSLRFVISNTTEAGIAYVDEALKAETCPTGFPAKITALLYHRFQQLGASAKTGLVFLPCELIEANGTNLRRIVVQHARAWGLPQAFIDWIERDNYFLNTLVDRIVPGFPSTEATGLGIDYGYDDALLVAAEPFHLWVIEAPAAVANALADEFPLHKAGLDVVWTQDLQPFRTRKVRILNGAHTASALAAFGCGLDTVKNMTEDEVVAQYLHKLMFDEIVPFVQQPEAERRRYAQTILERFTNPYIRHELISIALNSVSKWQVRVLPTVKDYMREHGKPPPCLSFSLAALLNFYQGTYNAEGAMLGARQGKQYPIKDNPEVLAVMGEAWRGWRSGDDLAPLVHTLLSDARLWGEDLSALPGLENQVEQSLTRIKAVGVRAAMADLVKTASAEN